MAQPRPAGETVVVSAHARPLILYVLGGYPPAANLEAYPDQLGGAELQARRVAHLLRDDFEIRVLTAKPEGPRSAPLLDDPWVRRVPLAQGFGSLGLPAAIGRLVAAGLREPRPAVVQAAQFNGVTVAAALLARMRRVPLVIKIAGKCNLDDAAVGRRRLQLQILVRSAAAIVAPSHGALAAALEHSIPRHKLRLIPNGVDTDYFHPPDPETRSRARAALGYQEDDFVFCWIGRLHHHKGLACVPPAWRQLESLRPHARLLLVAEGEQSYVAQNLVTHHPASVRWIGFRSDLRSIYAAADAFLLTSPSEGLSNVLLEALASGLPAVVSATPENLEVGTGEDFLLGFDRSSPESLTEALVLAVDRRASRVRLGAAARRRTEDAYSLRSTAASWRALHHSLIEGESL